MANAKILEAKQSVIDEITDVAKNSASFILFDYRGLTAEETSELRKLLRENSSQYKVWKNTLTKRALDNLKLNLDDCLNGPSAMAYSDDSVAPIKALSDFAKDHPALEIKGGIVDGKVASLDEIRELSTIPSREGLLTMLAAGLIGTVKDLSIALNMLSEEKEKNE
ncbi:MAG: 50S ribosomal protein L10 [Bacilli bacterium]|nr:50S ribosomal protein L10 [Bacilli bacterium]